MMTRSPPLRATLIPTRSWYADFQALPCVVSSAMAWALRWDLAAPMIPPWVPLSELSDCLASAHEHCQPALRILVAASWSLLPLRCVSAASQTSASSEVRKLSALLEKEFTLPKKISISCFFLDSCRPLVVLRLLADCPSSAGPPLAPARGPCCTSESPGSG